MAPAFSKQAILRGDADYLCLVCENYFRSEHEVISHITQISHRDNLKNTTFVDKYKGDRVKKVKRWYFCEFCNTLLPTLAKIGLHVEESRHAENKSQFFERVGDLVIQSDNVVIDEDTWHGLTGGACTLCNVEFDDKELHKRETTHVIHLIQSKIIHANSNVYRKMVDCTFHCLTCNEVVADIEAHFDRAQHKELLQKCRDLKKIEENLISNIEESRRDKMNTHMRNDNVAASCSDPIKRITEVSTSPNIDIHDVYSGQKIDICLNEKKCNSVIKPSEIKKHLNDLHNKTALQLQNRHEEDQKYSDNIIYDKNNDSSQILNEISHFQRSHININFESRTAVCKRCSKHLDFNALPIENHIREHENDQNKKDFPKLPTPDNFEKDDNYKSDSKTLHDSPVALKQHVGENKEMLPTKSILNEMETRTVENNGSENDKQNGNKNHNVTKDSSKSEKTTSSKENLKKRRENNNSYGKSKNSKGNEVIKDSNNKKCNLQKVYTHFFITKMTKFLDENEPFLYFILNEKFCINLFSLLLISFTSPERLRCLICQVNLSGQNFTSHVNENTHTMMTLESFVVIHASEFIREIRSGLFHCGFCNIIATSWLGMENHLKSVSHKESKTSANWRLVQHSSEIQRNDTVLISEKDFLRFVLQNL